MTDEQLFNMSDEDLEAAFIEAKADMMSPDTTYEEVNSDYDNNDDEVEYLEQPDEDSDDDTSIEDEDYETTDDESDTTDDELDGDIEEEEEYTEPVMEEAPMEIQPIQKQKFKANGKEYEFTDDEIRTQFPKIFGQAMDYTRKMQAIKPWRKTIDAIEGAKLNHDDVNLMIDVLKGDKDAVAAVLKRTGVDALDLDVDNSKYVAKDYGRNETELAIKDVVDKISVDPEYNMTHRVLSSEWDDRSFKEMTDDPELIELLHMDVKSGMFNKVQPIAEKLKVYGRGAKSDLDYYKEAAGIYFGELRQEESRLAETERSRRFEVERIEAEKAKVAQVRAHQQKIKTVKQESVKRKAAAPTRAVSGAKKSTNYLDDSDESFEEWYKSVEARM
jgi:hypothetical protein